MRDDSALDKRAVRDEVSQHLKARFSRKEIEARVLALLARGKSARLAELGLTDDEDYVSTIYAAAYGLDQGSAYTFHVLPGSERAGSLGVPRGELTRKGKK